MEVLSSERQRGSGGKERKPNDPLHVWFCSRCYGGAYRSSRLLICPECLKPFVQGEDEEEYYPADWEDTEQVEKIPQEHDMGIMKNQNDVIIASSRVVENQFGYLIMKKVEKMTDDELLDTFSLSTPPPAEAYSHRGVASRKAFSLDYSLWTPDYPWKKNSIFSDTKRRRELSDDSSLGSTLPSSVSSSPEYSALAVELLHETGFPPNVSGYSHSSDDAGGDDSYKRLKGEEIRGFSQADFMHFGFGSSGLDSSVSPSSSFLITPTTAQRNVEEIATDTGEIAEGSDGAQSSSKAMGEIGKGTRGAERAEMRVEEGKYNAEGTISEGGEMQGGVEDTREQKIEDQSYQSEIPTLDSNTIGAEELRNPKFHQRFYQQYCQIVSPAGTFIVQLWAWLRRATRPILKDGYRRLEWKCDCGDNLYADFPDFDDGGALDRLLSSLQNPTPQCVEGTSSVPLQDMGSSVNSDSTAGTRDLSTPMESNPSSNGSTISGSEVSTGSSFTSISQGSGTLPKFLALCVNIGGIYKTLAEIEVSNTDSDLSVFQKMKAAYWKVRGVRGRFSYLVRPVGVEFVHFNLWSRRRGYVAVCERPDSIPPLDSREYEYVPKPLKPSRPMPQEIFIHYLGHGEGDLNPCRNDWLPRLPKRLERRVIDTGDDQSPGPCYGWGMHVIEGPDRSVILGIVVLTIFVSILTSAIWSAVRGDVQGGFAIGAMIVALPPIALTAVVFRLEGL